MDSNAPMTMSLAGLAYGSPGFIADYLATEPVGGMRWELTWIADDLAVPVNFAFLVRDPATDRYVLAIRGTYPDPFSSAYWDDGRQDSPFGAMQPWPGADGAKVSAGTWAGFTGVRGLVGAGRRLEAVIAGLRGSELLVTGHSLGGTLAQVVGLWATTVSAMPVAVYAFAGMTPGNRAFADLFGAKTRLAGRVWRYNNRLDTVGYGWDRVLRPWWFYRPAPQGGWLVQLLLLISWFRLWSYGFAAVGREVKLPGTVRPPTIGWIPIAYVIETLHQHMPDTYLALLGAPPLPFRIGFGAIVDQWPISTLAAPATGAVAYLGGHQAGARRGVGRMDTAAGSGPTRA